MLQKDTHLSCSLHTKTPVPLNGGRMTYAPPSKKQYSICLKMFVIKNVLRNYRWEWPGKFFVSFCIFYLWFIQAVSVQFSDVVLLHPPTRVIGVPVWRPLNLPADVLPWAAQYESLSARMQSKESRHIIDPGPQQHPARVFRAMTGNLTLGEEPRGRRCGHCSENVSTITKQGERKDPLGSTTDRKGYYQLLRLRSMPRAISLTELHFITISWILNQSKLYESLQFSYAPVALQHQP